MPSKTQIIPEHEYPHVMVVEHDNSQRPSDRSTTVLQTYCNMLFVIASPKGIDREIQTISNGYDDFVERMGLGSYDNYGQPYLNALNAASTDAATLYCLRVTAEDATYAGGALVAHYRVTPAKEPEVPEPEEPVIASDKVDVMGRENVLASDEVDETTGKITIKLAGTEVTPGISDENADLFGGVTGDFIDVTIQLDKVAPDIDPDKDYQITQTNPLLEMWMGTDQYISAEGDTFIKQRVYHGSDLKGQGFAVLVGTSPVSISIVEYGIKEQEPVVDVIIDNQTDLAIEIVDDKCHATVSKSSNIYTINLTGEAVPGFINPELWGDVDESDFVEVDLKFPVGNSGTEYRLWQRNDAVLPLYATDSRITDETDADGNTYKVKMSKFADSILSEEGVGYLVPAKGDVEIRLYDESTFEDTATSVPTMIFKINSNLEFVAEHPVPPEPQPEPLGDPIEVEIQSSLLFEGNTSTASMLRARAAINKMERVAYAQAEEEAEDLNGSMEIYFTFEPAENVTDISTLGEMVEVDSVEADEDGWRAIKIFEVISRGRGEYGNNVRFVINSYARGDKLATYKNYNFTVYQIEKATLVQKEPFVCSFMPDAVDADGNTLYLDYIVGDPYENSQYIDVWTNPTAIQQLFAAYLEAVPGTGITAQQFDPLTGTVFGNSLAKIPYLTISSDPENAVTVTGASGIALGGGSDGAFEIGKAGREQAMQDAYLKAWTGEIDRNIFSRKLYPTDIILDANLPIDCKAAISNLTHTRKDTMTFYDLGTSFNTYNGLLEELAELEPFVATRDEAIEAYYGKTQDPLTFKIITVTSTYPLARMYPLHFQSNGAKHVPMSGSSYGVLNGYINKSAYPVFDDDLDEDSRRMDQLTSMHVNYLKVNSLKQVVRATQDTRQDADTNLSECSNVFVLHDIRRDCVMLCEQYEYNFAEAADLQRFNKAAGILADKYAAAQVSSITAQFEMNDWELERGILHLYVEFVHKRIIKRAIVEIDINRGSVVV